MTKKYNASEECITVEDAMFTSKALDTYITDQTKKEAYDGDIRSAIAAKDAINFVLVHAI